MECYKEMTLEEGRKFLPYIFNIFFKSLEEDEFFVEPWRERWLRGCAEFSEEVDDMMFFITRDEDLIKSLIEDDKFFLFGAYNTFNVVQMRACVVASIVNTGEDDLRERLRNNTEKKVVSGTLEKKEAEKIYQTLEGGQVFKFQIKSYAYKMYQRG